MQKLSIAAAGSALLIAAAMGSAAPALADGYAAKKVAYERPADWSGVYFGIGSGYQWSSVDVRGPGIGITSDHDDQVVSGHIGLQHQFGSIVLGVEGGWMTSIRDNDGDKAVCDSVTPSLTNPQITPGNFCSARFNDVLTIGARVGYAAGHWMPYLTGGYANGAFDFATRIPAAAGFGATTLVESAHARLDGWYLGGGFEYVISPGWTAGLEYRHYDFGTASTTAFDPRNGTALETVRFDANTDVVTARVSWRWGRPDMPAPLK